MNKIIRRIIFLQFFHQISTFKFKNFHEKSEISKISTTHKMNEILFFFIAINLNNNF